MNHIKPKEVLEKVVDAIPEDCRENIVVIGSLAAAYAYFGNNNKMSVRTKDVDCLLRPFKEATKKGQMIARQMLDAGWKQRLLGEFTGPGTADTPDDKLPAIRLYPPDINSEVGNPWFIELLTEPESPKDKGKKWARIIIEEGHFGLPTYRYLSIATFLPEKIDDLGIYYSRSEMMVLANLLEHPEIKPDIMSTKFEGRKIKRSNKNLGRVLAVGFLAQQGGLKDFRSWGLEWKEALKYCFPDEWKTLVHDVRKGLIALLNSDQDMNEAHHTCVYGLLNSYGPTEEDLREVGDRILGEAIDRLEKMADEST